MTHCAKCGAELIGTRKFCTACGAPAGDPRSPAASTGMTPAAPGSSPVSSRFSPQSASPSIQYAPPPPVSKVDPFARTAGPATAEQAARGLVAAATPYGPPPSIPLELATTTPGVGDPAKGPHVSPLATSNVDSGRGAFVEAMAKSARGSALPALPPRQGSSPDSSSIGIKRGGVPGTQMMPSIPNPSVVPSTTPGAGVASVAQPSGPGGKRPDRTQLIGVFPGIPGSQPGAMPGSQPGAMPGSQGHTPSTAPIAPIGRRDSSMPAAPPPPPPLGTPPYAPAPSQHAPAQHLGPGVPLPVAPGWQPPAPPSGYGYGFSYAPGSRVTVTWSNGQRYPGTITQVTGNQCLVVFPDGQHHWVEMQYLAPG